MRARTFTLNSRVMLQHVFWHQYQQDPLLLVVVTSRAEQNMLSSWNHMVAVGVFIVDAHHISCFLGAGFSSHVCMRLQVFELLMEESLKWIASRMPERGFFSSSLTDPELALLSLLTKLLSSSGVSDWSCFSFFLLWKSQRRFGVRCPLWWVICLKNEGPSLFSTSKWRISIQTHLPRFNVIHTCIMLPVDVFLIEGSSGIINMGHREDVVQYCILYTPCHTNATWYWPTDVRWYCVSLSAKSEGAWVIIYIYRY